MAMTERGERMKNRRVVIVYDGRRWHVRRVRVIEHDMDRDEQVYRCDKPLANDCISLEDAIKALEAAR